MKTDDLIAALAADTMPQPNLTFQMLRAIPLCVALSLVALIVVWGPRADLSAALTSFAVLKTLVPLVLVAFAFALALAMAQPATPFKRPGLLLGAAIALALGVFFATVLRDGQAALVNALSTPSLWVCLSSIPALALPILGGVLWALSSGATMRPRLTGAIAGLAAGGLAASVYSLYCDKDMILFVIPSYSTAVGAVMLLGAVLGPRLLKW